MMDAEQKLEIVTLWKLGRMTAKQISERFENTTKNAILGVVHRWTVVDGVLTKIPERGPPVKRERRKTNVKMRADQVQKAYGKEPEPETEEEPEPEVKAEIIDASEDMIGIKTKPLIDKQVNKRAPNQRDVPFEGTSRTQCQWPGWKAGEKKSTMCGLPVPSGSKIPYCKYHYRASYNAPQGRRGR